MTENILEIDELLKITAGGLTIADFTEIRSALINKYRDTYGSDIDLSTASADGVFVNNLALLINNILQTVGILYNNLDVNNANGTYLDTLCELSNITRKQATYSATSLLVSNTGISTLSNLENLQFIDQAGNTWTHSGTETFTAGEIKELSVVCDQVGPVKAPAGWINKTVQVLPLSVIQENSASVGTDIESDSELRARRLRSNGVSGLTVLESLSAALLNIVGIEDVYIYNNNTGGAITSKDTTTIDAHSVYIVIRRNTDVTIADSTIGTIIHEKLTPGIHTCDSGSAATYGTAKHYEYVVSAFGIQIPEGIVDVYWKDATPVAPQIDILINPASYFITTEFESISESLISYLDNLRLSTNLIQTDFLVQVVNADPMYKNNQTYTVGTITFTDATNYDTYYNYNDYTYIINTGTVGSNTISNGSVTIGGTTYTMVQNGLKDSNDTVYEIVDNKVTISSVEYVVSATQYKLSLIYNSLAG